MKIVEYYWIERPRHASFQWLCGAKMTALYTVPDLTQFKHLHFALTTLQHLKCQTFVSVMFAHFTLNWELLGLDFWKHTRITRKPAYECCKMWWVFTNMRALVWVMYEGTHTMCVKRRLLNTVHVGLSCRVRTLAPAFPSEKFTKKKRCCWWIHVTKSKKKMFCKYVCLSVNVYVCMNVSCCWKCAAEFFHGVRLEKHLKKERKTIKHFAASLLRHLHQRNTNGYNTQTTPRFGRKWNEIARFLFFSFLALLIRCFWDAHFCCI